jgi:hypothetical protein
MINDPERIANELLQCLTEVKRPIGFLLGAGCPYSIKGEDGKPLIPDIAGLTQAVRDTVCGGDCAQPWDKIYKQILKDTGKEPNIEDVLSRVRGLRDLAGDGEVRGLRKAELDKLERNICESTKNCMKKELKDKSTAYHNVGNWIGSIDRSEPIEIFTTNYDLLFEQALEDFRIPFFDGFVGSRRPFFDPHAVEFDKLPIRWARLWKLHGSINWRCGLVEGNFEVWRSSTDDGGDVVIHPSHLKYEESRKMPYLALMDRLRRFISTPSSTLITVGYSFADQHINDVIIQSAQGTPTAATFALMYGELNQYRSAINIAKRLSNLSLIAQNGAVIGTKEALWIESNEKPDSNLPSGVLEWTHGAEDSKTWKASVSLGDFRCFGGFLQNISGMRGAWRQ